MKVKDDQQKLANLPYTDEWRHRVLGDITQSTWISLNDDHEVNTWLENTWPLALTWFKYLNVLAACCSLKEILNKQIFYKFWVTGKTRGQVRTIQRILKNIAIY